MKCHQKSKNPKKEIESLLDKLRESGSRITNQRKAMANAVVKFNKPFSAEQLHSKVQESGIDIVTVYRSLSIFVELGVLETVDFHDGTLRYEYNNPEEKGHHHHIICKKCKNFEPVNFCVVQGQEQLLEQRGYSDITHKLEFFGLCNQCSTYTKI